jgi:hypothetical protein
MGLGLVVSVALPASATTRYNAGNCTSKGGFATCEASGSAYHPYAFYINYASSPRQKLTVFWSMVCSKGTSAASGSGQFTVTGKGEKWVRHPLTEPDSCDIAAEGSLNGSGWIHIWIEYTRWS